MGIELAWIRANGSGVTMGLVDTGIATTQPELNGNFTSGESSGRWIDNFIYYEPACSHGTRMAGVMAAPKNGKEAVGVAWKSNLTAYHHANDTWGLDGWDAAQGVRYVADKGAMAIALAFQVETNSNYLADEIRKWHSTTQIIFIGAAGTSPSGVPDGNVVFPAEMPEVFAVTGADYGSPSSSCGDCHCGPEVMLAGYINQATQGLQAGDVTNINGSSVAVATITGVAALIYARNPGASRTFVEDRLRYSGHLYPNRNDYVGYGVVNAMKALGGMYRVDISGQTEFLTSTSVSETYTLHPHTGDSSGPLSFYWQNNGSTSQSSTFEFPAPPVGVTETHNIYWSVTDHSDGNVISRTTVVQVTGCDPTGQTSPSCAN